MRDLTKKQKKILYIVAAAGLLLLALGILGLALFRPAPREEASVETPPPETTAAPLPGTVTVAGKEVDPETVSFDLSGRILSEQDKAEIASLKNLTTLSLNGCGVTDLMFLTGLGGLRTLYLPDNRITDVTPLAALTGLRTLYLDKNPVTDLTPLTALPELTMLSLQGVSIASYALADLREAMPGCHIFCDTVVEAARPISIGGLAFTEDVEVLDLSYRNITDIGKLSYCLQLRELNLSGDLLNSLSVLSGLPKLTVLYLENCGLTDEDLAFLQTLRRLTYLDMRNNEDLSAEAVDDLKTALPQCQIYHDNVYYTVRLGGRKLTSDMVQVDLSGLGLEDITGLEKFEMLRLLDLRDNRIRDLTPLGNCTALSEINLRNNDISDLTPLYACRALRELDLTGNDALQADQIRQLQEALPACRIVTDVDLSMPEPTPPPPDIIPEFPEDMTVG